jgi:hypothetical protein
MLAGMHKRMLNVRLTLPGIICFDGPDKWGNLHEIGAGANNRDNKHYVLSENIVLKLTMNVLITNQKTNDNDNKLHYY